MVLYLINTNLFALRLGLLYFQFDVFRLANNIGGKREEEEPHEGISSVAIFIALKSYLVPESAFWGKQFMF